MARLGACCPPFPMGPWMQTGRRYKVRKGLIAGRMEFRRSTDKAMPDDDIVATASFVSQDRRNHARLRQLAGCRVGPSRGCEVS